MLAFTGEGANSTLSTSITFVRVSSPVITSYPKVPEYLNAENCTVETTSCQESGSFNWAFDAITTCFQCTTVQPTDLTDTPMILASSTTATSTSIPGTEFANFAMIQTSSTTVTSSITQSTSLTTNSRHHDIGQFDPNNSTSTSAGPSSKLSSSMSQSTLPPLSISSASYVEYLASFVSSVAVNNVPTSSIDDLLVSKIIVWTVSPTSQANPKATKNL